MTVEGLTLSISHSLDPTVEDLPEGCCNHTDGNCSSKTSPASSVVTGPDLEQEANYDADQIRSPKAECTGDDRIQTTRLGLLKMNAFEVLRLRLMNMYLKKEHINLSNEVKIATADSFPGLEVLDIRQHLSKENELLKRRFLVELSERKRLHTEVIELKGNIRVFCRCRPLNQVKKANGSSCVVEFDSSQDNELQIISSDFSKM